MRRAASTFDGSLSCINSSEAQPLDADENSAGRLARRLCNRRRVDADLTPVAVFSSSRDLAICFVVDDGPRPVFLEREIDYALDERAVGEHARHRRLAAAATHGIGAASAHKQIGCQHPLNRVESGYCFFGGRRKNPAMDFDQTLDV